MFPSKRYTNIKSLWVTIVNGFHLASELKMNNEALRLRLRASVSRGIVCITLKIKQKGGEVFSKRKENEIVNK